MPDDATPPPSGAPTGRAWRLYSDFLAANRRDDARAFDAFCQQHKDDAEALRQVQCQMDAMRGAYPGEEHAEDLEARIQRKFGKHIDPRISLDKDDAEPATPTELWQRLESHRAPSQRYLMDSLVAKGGMGAILKVWDRELRRFLAMKVLKSSLDEGTPPDAGAPHESDTRQSIVVARFLEEAQITAQLHHPGVVPIHELGLDTAGNVYFTMQLVKGRDLEHVFQLCLDGKDGWNTTRALGVLLKACEAVAFAHAKKVIHRDLKPNNIMVGRFGETYVMDWGLAKVLGAEDRHDVRVKDSHSTAVSLVRTDRKDLASEDPGSPLVTLDGDVLGTPCYMPPEQARGAVDEMGPASDVYSMGAILYHLLSGKPPYCDGEARPTPLTILKLVCGGPPTTLRTIAVKIPEELIAICERAMARDGKARYVNMSQMADDLRAYLEHRVVKAYETGAWAEFRKWVARNRTTAIAAAAALLTAVGATAWVFAIQANATRVIEAKNQDLTRLSDTRLLQDLIDEASRLWPAHVEKNRDLDAWLARARRVAERKPIHQKTLDELRAKAIRAPSTPGSDGLDFAKEEDRWQHDVLTTLMKQFAVFTNPDPAEGIVANVEKRLDDATHLRERSIDAHAAQWTAAIAAVRDLSKSPQYGGMALTPQLGLVPLGPDSRSGLYEFAHLPTGSPAKRGVDGTLILTEETGLVFVLIPRGTFQMGSKRPAGDPASVKIADLRPNEDPNAEEDQGPVHSVTVDAFFLSKYEMTQGQWRRHTGRNPSQYKVSKGQDSEARDLTNPVESVSFEDCERALWQLGLTLPTEAQWEYAARAGSGELWYSGNEKISLDGHANLLDTFAHGKGMQGTFEDWLDDRHHLHSRAGTFQPNRFGLHDIAGNVLEWCLDKYHPDYNREIRPGDGEHRNPDGVERVARGGAFDYPAHDARTAFRRNYAPDFHSSNLGVRPALAVERGP